MWMLMEGVVLYVALVKVFVKYHKRYIAAFTAASYGRLVPKNCTKADMLIYDYCRHSISIHGSCRTSWILGQHRQVGASL